MSDFRGVRVDGDQALVDEGGEHVGAIAVARFVDGDPAPHGHAVGDLNEAQEEPPRVDALIRREFAVGVFRGPGDRVANAAARLVCGDGEQPAAGSLPGREQCVGKQGEGPGFVRRARCAARYRRREIAQQQLDEPVLHVQPGQTGWFDDRLA